MTDGPLPTTFAHWVTLHGLVTSVALLAYVANARGGHTRRHPAAAIAWVLFIVLLPYLALPAFLTFGSRKLARPPSPRADSPDQGAGRESWVAATLSALGQAPAVSYAALQVHGDGREARRALLDIIDGATVSIDVCTFALARDELGDAVVARLCAKAEAGLRVRLLIDGVGSLMVSRPQLAPLRRAGGEVALFVPPWRSPHKGRTNLRNHRKLLIADATLPRGRLWAGGRNLAAEYFEGAPGHPAWRDLSFDLAGQLVQQAVDLFEHDWAFAHGRTVDPRPSTGRPIIDGSQPASQGNAALPDALVSAGRGRLRPALGLSGVGAQIVASGPDQADDTLHALLLTAAYRAQHRIALVTPYFVPDAALLNALCLAARRGVVVTLLLPERSNHRLSDLARGRALRALAEAGARLRLAPGMLHAKLVVVDEVLALVGSANLDSRSLFLNYELMFAIQRQADVQRFGDWFDEACRTASHHRPAPPGLLRDLSEGLLLWLGFQL